MRVRCVSNPLGARPPFHTNSDTQCRQCQAAAETLKHVVFHCTHNSTPQRGSLSPLFLAAASAADGSDTNPIPQQRAFFAQTSQHKLAALFPSHLF